MTTGEALARAFAALGYAMKWWYREGHVDPQDGAGCIEKCRKCEVSYEALMRMRVGTRSRRDIV